MANSASSLTHSSTFFPTYFMGCIFYLLFLSFICSVILSHNMTIIIIIMMMMTMMMMMMMMMMITMITIVILLLYFIVDRTIT